MEGDNLNVFISAVWYLSKVSPLFKRFFWRQSYQFLAKKYPEAYWTFMNCGYALQEGETPISLHEEDEVNRYCIELYRRVAGAVDLGGKDVLEVGCGRGGGASFVARYLQPAHMVGVDISAQAVALCKRLHVVDTLAFEVGDAEDLPFEDATFDAVVNVESSHCYGSIPTFLDEVFRVLGPGGYFLIADFRVPQEVGLLRQQVNDAGFVVCKEADITSQVSAALVLDNERKRNWIHSIIDPKMMNTFENFAGLEGTQMFDNLHNGTCCYVQFVLQKPGDERV